MGVPVVTTSDLEDLYRDAPRPVMAARGQLTVYDRLLYFWSAKEFYRGEGAIVDGGTLVGGSTVVLSEGLLANRHVGTADGAIIAYDLFEDAADGYSARLLKEWYGETDDESPVYDFEPHFRRAIEPYARFVTVHRGDITTIGYHDDRPIELLSVDVAKTPDLMHYVATTFFPRLIPGRSLILHQDYIFPFQPWLHIAMELLAEMIEHVYDVPTNCTSAFVPRAPITTADVERRLGRCSADWYRLENASYLHRAAERATTRMGKTLLGAAVAYFYLVMGRRETADLVIRRLIDQFDVSLEFVERSDLKSVFAHIGVDYRTIYGLPAA